MSKGRYLVSTLSFFQRATKGTHDLAIKFIAKKPEHVRNCEGWVRLRSSRITSCWIISRLIRPKWCRSFCRRTPKSGFHLTPTYSSWLNKVELWFAKIQRDV